MSVRLGLILSRNINSDQLECIRLKYNLGLISITNSFIGQQLSEDECFFQVSKSECDDLSGIGTFEIYNKDLTPLKSTITDKALLESVISEYQNRCEGYKRDTIRWVNIMRDLKNNFKIQSIAIFWHVCSASFEEDQFLFQKKERCNANTVDYIFLMKLKENTLLYFD